MTLIAFAGGHGGVLSHEHLQPHMMYMPGAAHPIMMTMGAADASMGPSILGELPLWIVMAAAMMLPTGLPAVRHVARNSLRWRQQRAVGVFVVTYLAVWTIFGVVALSVALLCSKAAGSGSEQGPILLAGALAAAGLWQLTPHKQRFLRACHRTVALPPRGWRANAACARFAFRYGSACLGSCYLLMGAMAFVHSAHLLWTALLTAVIAIETFRTIKSRDLRWIGGLLIACAIAVAIV